MERQLELEQSKYSEKQQELKNIFEDILYHRECFPDSFQKHSQIIRKNLKKANLDAFDLMDKTGWCFELTIANIERHKGLETEYISEILELLKTAFEELISEDRLFCFACEGVQDSINILIGQIKLNSAKFKYDLKEMLDSDNFFERKIADYFEFTFTKLKTLDYNDFINLFLNDNKNMAIAILKMNEMPFAINKFFFDSHNQQVQSRVRYLRNRIFLHPQNLD